ncbi:hypothetical protein ABFS83_04G211800 [Erythranthe nasuta]
MAAACGSFDHIFDKPLSESPTFLESLSPWKHIKKSIDNTPPSFTELFGELHFKDNHVDINNNNNSPTKISKISNGSKSLPSSIKNKKDFRHSESFSSMNSESLSMCTEGLGFESFDEVDGLSNDEAGKKNQVRRRMSILGIKIDENNYHRYSIITGETPPPLSCIGRSAEKHNWLCFISYREGGRLILKEVRIPMQEFLHACRENGRLKMQFIHSDEEDEEEEEEKENIQDRILSKNIDIEHEDE